jgi:hypothetical protein
MSENELADKPVTVNEVRFPALNMSDACDACGFSDEGVLRAAAYVRVLKEDKDMMFCGHHYATFEASLLVGGWTVYEDSRAKLNTKPGASA